MIANEQELEVALGNLRACEDALEQLRAELQRSNPALLSVVSASYVSRMQALQSDIAAYLEEHPAEQRVRA
ncbi:MAG: hypothetical protein FJX75_16760 [Armatimonadetes bacterium]|nr:hypothetical protein [Armatimonadota bacterium]